MNRTRIIAALRRTNSDHYKEWFKGHGSIPLFLSPWMLAEQWQSSLCQRVVVEMMAYGVKCSLMDHRRQQHEAQAGQCIFAKGATRGKPA